jgi:hypothetical protein
VAIDNVSAWESEGAGKTLGTQKTFGLSLAGDGKRRVRRVGQSLLGSVPRWRSLPELRREWCELQGAGISPKLCPRK